MKKILLSLAVIAASGGYVAVENYNGNLPSTDSAALSISTLPMPATKNRIDVGSLQPAATAQDSAPPPALPALAQTGVAAETAPPSPTPAMPASRSSVDVAELAPAQVPGTATVLSDASPATSLPALPRPRPAAAPQAAIAQPSPQVAQAAVTASTQNGQFRDGTYKGSSANAYYGRVQVSAVVSGGQLVSINVLQYPNDRRTSRYINGQALPRLEQEAIQAQSARVDTVSGATLTSNAYRQSLAAALSAAGGGNA
ncbi:MAG: FMN-binding protein [Devosia sp.]|nr:FMN-binding protein [Devosia sp.]